MKISKAVGDVELFEGDCIVVPCDVDLTYRKANDVIREVCSKAGKELWEELADIRYTEIGQAVITQGYNLKAKHLIFLPYTDREDTSHRMNYLLLHQAIRSALSLASLYNLKSLAIPIIPGLLSKRENPVRKLLPKIWTDGKEDRESDEAEGIVESIARSFESSSVNEVTIYVSGPRNSKM